MDNLLYLCGIAGIIGGSAIKPAGRNGIAKSGACHHKFFQIIITAMLESVCAIFQPTQEQMALFIEMFVGRLPEYIRDSLAKASPIA